MAHIQKRSDQRYRVRYRDPNGSERSRSFSRLTDARRFKSNVEEELARGLWVDPRAGRTLFQDFATPLAEGRHNLRPATRARISGFLRAQILPRFGEVPLNRITRYSVKAWVDELAATLAPRTVRDSYRILASLLREAVRQGFLRQSPCHLIALPRLARGEPRYLSAEEVERLAPHRSLLPLAHLHRCLSRASLERARGS